MWKEDVTVYTDADARAAEETEARFEDNLEISWNAGNASFNFPASIPVDVTSASTRGNNFVVELTLQQNINGVSLGQTVPESVELNSLSRVSPPAELCVGARTVQKQGGQLEARFNESAVSELLTKAGVNELIISGDFDVGNGSAFFGIGAR